MGFISKSGTAIPNGSVSELKLNFDIGTSAFLPVLHPDATGAGTWINQLSVGYTLCGSLDNDAAKADGDNVTFYQYLAAGTYTIDVCCHKSNSAGIMEVWSDAQLLDSIDLYAASNTFNQWVQTTGIVIATSGVKAIKLLINGKNGSSSSYRCMATAIKFWRTA